MLFGDFKAPRFPSPTWLYDGKTWSNPSGKPSPPPDISPLMTYDSHRKKIVMVLVWPGYNETWEWDAKGWTRVAVTRRPAKRVTADVAGITYDAARRRVVVVGGQDSTNPWAPRSDVWEYDGKTWTLVKPRTKSPPGRRYPALTWAPAFGGTVFLGGYQFVNPGQKLVWCHDVWVWDGSDWRELAVGGDHPPRGLMAARYDASRETIVGLRSSSPRSQPTFELRADKLSASNHHPRPGESFLLTANLPAQQHRPLLFALSTGTYAGIPVGTVTGLGKRVVPLRPDWLLDVSLAFPQVRKLDALGRATLSVPVPNLAALRWLDFHAAAVAFGPAGTISDVTNAVPFKIVR